MSNTPPEQPDDPYAGSWPTPPPPPQSYPYGPSYGQAPYDQYGQQQGQAPYPGGPGYGGPGYGAPGYGGPGAPYQQRPSQAMAIWALVLACLFFIPLAPLVGIGLAIAVLARSTTGLNYGRGKAIAALIIGGVVIVAWVLLFVLGATSDSDSGSSSGPSPAATGTPTATSTATPSRTPTPSPSPTPGSTSGSKPWFDLQVGDCFNQANAPDVGQTAHVNTASVVPCSSPHQFEVYGQFGLPGGDYPGQTAAKKKAQAGCISRFTSFVGVSLDHSALEYVWFYPLEGSWDLGHTDALCAVGSPAGKVVGTLKGSKK